MSKSPVGRNIEFGGPATYRIVVQGELAQEWSGRLGGMRIVSSSREGRAARTNLEGRIRDQAELSGVLGTLHGLHLPILEVLEIESEE
ncbi:MAG: hypothetical protein WBP10_09270 [Thermoanaerobaculia bacterium]